MSVWQAARNRQTERAFAWGALLILTLGLGLAVVLGRVVQLKINGTPGSNVLPVSSRIERSRRGDLMDCRGRVLATSTVGWRLFVDPVELDDPATIAVDLAEILQEDPAQLDRRILQATSRRYVVLADGLDAATAESIRRRGLSGVGLEPRLVRHYPQGDLASLVFLTALLELRTVVPKKYGS